MCSTALPDIERCRQVFPFKLSITWYRYRVKEERLSFSLFKRLYMQNERLGTPIVFTSICNFHRSFFRLLFLLHFFSLAYVFTAWTTSLACIVLRYIDSINPRLLRFMSIVSTVALQEGNIRYKSKELAILLSIFFSHIYLFLQHINYIFKIYDIFPNKFKLEQA